MILDALWRTIRAQFNKLASFFWEANPIALMQAEYDSAVAQIREGRTGLEQYRSFVERVGRQVARHESHVRRLDATVRTYLAQGDRETAARFALELQRARKELEENAGQLRLHEQAYENNLLKIKHAGGKLAEIRDKIARYDADLKMSAAEAEIARVAQQLNFDVHTDFGQIEGKIQDAIDRNRGRVRVAADLSGEGVEEVRQEEAARGQLAEEALREFERQIGSPEAAGSVSIESPVPVTRARGRVAEGR